MAAKAKRMTIRYYCKDLHRTRRNALRNNDISGWARCIRPNIRKSHGYAATWCKPEGEERRRPTNKEEARIGAAQEYEKLMKRPTNKWRHYVITPYTNGYGRSRGTLNVKVACMAPPGSEDRRIAQAYMGSPESGYSILYWGPDMVQVLSEDTVRINEHFLRVQDGIWKVASPKPRKGATGEVISICGEDPPKWSAQKWEAATKYIPHGGIIFA